MGVSDRSRSGLETRSTRALGPQLADGSVDDHSHVAFSQARQLRDGPIRQATRELQPEDVTLTLRQGTQRHQQSVLPFVLDHRLLGRRLRRTTLPEPVERQPAPTAWGAGDPGRRCPLKRHLVVQ
jgi:hypothetical protein